MGEIGIERGKKPQGCADSALRHKFGEHTGEEPYDVTGRELVTTGPGGATGKMIQRTM